MCMIVLMFTCLFYHYVFDYTDASILFDVSVDVDRSVVQRLHKST